MFFKNSKLNFNGNYKQNFLKKVSLEFESSLQDTFLKSKNKSSLSWIETIFPNTSILKKYSKFQAVMIGGSHIESAIASKISQKLELNNFQQLDYKTLDSQKLVEILLKVIDPRINLISLSFAFALKPCLRNGLLDGVLLNSSKEHNLDDLVGKEIGKWLENQIYTKTGRKIQINLANNLTALAYNKNWQDSCENLSNTIFGVVATGVNFGFFDKGSFVNLESGNFAEFESSSSFSEIEQKSANPGFHKLEKEIAENYLPKHFNIRARQANLDIKIATIEELFDLANQKIDQKSFKLNSDQKIKSLENYINSDLDKNLSQKLIQKLAWNILDRSAGLVAIQIAAIYRFKQKKQKKILKLDCIIEGKLFWGNPLYFELLKQNLQKLEIDLQNISFPRTRLGFLFGTANLLFFQTPEQKKQVLNIIKIFSRFWNFIWNSQAPPVIYEYKIKLKT